MRIVSFMVALGLIIVALSSPAYAQKETRFYGKSYKEILAMGEMKWADYGYKKIGDNNANLREIASIWNQCIALDIGDRTAKLPAAQQKAVRQFLANAFVANDALNVIEYQGARGINMHLAISETRQSVYMTSQILIKSFSGPPSPKATPENVAALNQQVELRLKKIAGQISSLKLGDDVPNIDNPIPIDENNLPELKKSSTELQTGISSLLSVAKSLKPQQAVIIIGYLAKRMKNLSVGTGMY